MSNYHHHHNRSKHYSYGNSSNNNDNDNHRYRDVYLTDKKVQHLQQLMKRKYYERLERASVQNYKPKITTSTSNDNVILPPINRLSNLSRQLMFSDKLRKEQFEHIKKYEVKLHKKQRPYLDQLTTTTNNNETEHNSTKDIRKAQLPKITKHIIDPHPIPYKNGYIDDIENKYIKPFTTNNNTIITDYIQNKKSLIPFNFIIH